MGAMPLTDDAIRLEVDRFRSLTKNFRDRVAEGTTVGDEESERERIYEILVAINDFIEDKLRQT